MVVRRFHYWLSLGLLLGCNLNSGTNKKNPQNNAGAQQPVSTQGPPGQFDAGLVPAGTKIADAQVSTWIQQDRATVAAGDAAYMRYVSLHGVHNDGASVVDLNLARVALSKVLNASSRHAAAIVNPKPIGQYHLVYRVDVRDYWGRRYANGSRIVSDPSWGVKVWSKIDQDKGGQEFSDARKIAYYASRPEIYNDIMEIPPLADMLETQLGVVKTSLSSFKFMTVSQAITINKRILWRADVRPNAQGKPGYYWRTGDIFVGKKFPYYDQPIPEFDSKLSQVKDTVAEIIFSLDNGLQGYMIAGFGNQIRPDAFKGIVGDPVRPNQRLVVGISCHSCHLHGLQAASDEMNPYLRTSGAKLGPAVLDQALKLYPGNEVMAPIMAQDTARFHAAMQQVVSGMLGGITAGNLLEREPIFFLSAMAQQRFGYQDTISN